MTPLPSPLIDHQVLQVLQVGIPIEICTRYVAPDGMHSTQPRPEAEHSTPQVPNKKVSVSGAKKPQGTVKSHRICGQPLNWENSTLVIHGITI